MIAKILVIINQKHLSEDNPSQLNDLDELLSKYDKLRSIANSGSFDRKMITGLEFLKRIAEWKVYGKISRNTYVLPFAMKHVGREIRITLRFIFKLHEMNYLRTERSDKESKKAMDTITEYLKEVPKIQSTITRLRTNSFSILSIVIGTIPIMLSIILSKDLSEELKSWFIIGGVSVGILVMFGIAPVYLNDKILNYFLGRKLYNDWMKRLAIKDLRERIIAELIVLNNKTYDELERKFQ
ncbi:MAG: hypothetical protein HZA82_03395 [Thaumarchaeota archaeon]|nr:hypothetical protein [Nitrososphaerota archaeon]